jgi:hypothetical protein
MSSLSNFKRRLKPNRVYLAQKVAEKKIEFAKQVVLDRAKRDAEFAADVLKAVGDNLPIDIKETCEKSVADAKTKALVEKWDKCEMVTDLSTNSNAAILLESQEQPLLPENVSLGDGK